MVRRASVLALAFAAGCLGGKVQAQDGYCDKIIRVVARHHTNDLAASRMGDQRSSADQERKSQILEIERQSTVGDLGCDETEYNEVISCINDTVAKGADLDTDGRREVVTTLCAATPSLNRSMKGPFPGK